MCTELILAIIYFLTILIINYFIFKLIKMNFTNIFYLIKVEKIFQYFLGSQKKNIFYYLIQLKKNPKNPKIISLLNNILDSNDLLLIGSTYQFLSKHLETTQKSSQKEFVSNKLYFKLLENQYLSKEL